MKRIIITLVTLVVVSLSIQAEIKLTPITDDPIMLDADKMAADYFDVDKYLGSIYKPIDLSIGPKVGGGIVFAPGTSDQLYIDGGIGYGYTFGADISLRFGKGSQLGTKRFGVTLELLYDSRTVHTLWDNFGIKTFDVPVMFQYYFVPTLAIEAGVTFCAGISGSPSDFTYIDDNYADGTFDLTKARPNDIMPSFGLRLQTKKGFTMTMRYNISTSGIAGNFPIKPSTLTLGVGWVFNIVK